MEGAIRSDLKILAKSGEPLRLGPSSPPAWYLERDESRELSKIREYVIKGLMAKHRPKKQADDDILKGATLPPHGDAPSKDRTRSENLAIAERRFADVQQVQFEGIQGLLDTLRDARFETYEEARDAANRVMRLVRDSGGVLLLSGEYVDGRGRSKIYKTQHVLIICEQQGKPTFHLRPPDGQGYITALQSWPALYVVARESAGKPPDTSGGTPPERTL